MTLLNSKEELKAQAVRNNYAPEGYQLKNNTGLNVSLSSGMRAGQICSRQEQ